MAGIVSEAQPQGKAEPPVILCDSGGPIGARVIKALREAGRSAGWKVYEVNASRAPFGAEVMQYHRHRDQLWGRARDWVLDGGGIPPHAELCRQLLVAQFYEHEGAGPRGSATRFTQAKVTSKEDMREALERSPDLADAFCMAVWTPDVEKAVELGESDAREAAKRLDAKYGISAWDDDPSHALDPYSGGLDPYG